MSRRLSVLLLCGPYLLVILLLLVVPLAWLVDVSFREHSFTTMIGDQRTVANYLRIADGFYIGIVLETIALSLAATSIGAVIGFPLAYVLARSQGSEKAILTWLIMVPLMTSVVVKTFGWYVLLGYNGAVNTLLLTMSLDRIRWLGTYTAVLVGLVEFALPFMVLVVASAIERIPRNLEEAASNLGASPLGVVRHTLIPLSKTGIISGALLCFGISSSAYVVPAVMGGTNVRMIAQQIYDDIIVAFNWPGGAALSILLIIVLGSMVILSIHMSKQRR